MARAGARSEFSADFSNAFTSETSSGVNLAFFAVFFFGVTTFTRIFKQSRAEKLAVA